MKILSTLLLSICMAWCSQVSGQQYVSFPFYGPPPIYGYRFKITGDFNGDGKKDTLKEHYISTLIGKETNKYYDGIEYDSTVILTMKKEPACFISTGQSGLDTIFIGSYGQLLGLSLLHNEGDLDSNGTDELSYVTNVADWSSINTCHLLTYTEKGWKELLSFEIRDWQIPDMPYAGTQYGLFGAESVSVGTNGGPSNKQLERELLKFSFIQPIKKRVILISTIAQEETTLMDGTPVAPAEPIKKYIKLKTP